MYLNLESVWHWVCVCMCVFLNSPSGWTGLLTVRVTWPLRAAACMRSMTYRWGLPATGMWSTDTSSSPGRRRPSRSAGLFSMMAPMTICSWGNHTGISYIQQRPGTIAERSGKISHLPFGHAALLIVTIQKSALQMVIHGENIKYVDTELIWVVFIQ